MAYRWTINSDQNSSDGNQEARSTINSIRQWTDSTLGAEGVQTFSLDELRGVDTPLSDEPEKPPRTCSDYTSSTAPDSIGLKFAGSSRPASDLYEPWDGLDGGKGLGGDFEDEPWRVGDPFAYAPPKNNRHWEHVQSLGEKYDCEAWRDEIDKLLIFAGLFSAAVTAFVIESYRWIQEDFTVVSARLLERISVQLSNPTTTDPAPGSFGTFVPASANIRINIYWFLSLSMSLATVLIGILCTQWLREYRRYGGLPFEDITAIRQIRYEGLLKWRVPVILAFLPLLLQMALVLFFLGLIEFLWILDVRIAIPVTLAVITILVLMIFTTVSPGIQIFLSKDPELRTSQCPYKSPQAWLFLQFILVCTEFASYFRGLGMKAFSKISTAASKMALPFTNKIGSTSVFRSGQHISHVTAEDWVELDGYWKARRNEKSPIDLIAALGWVNRIFTQDIDVVHSIYYCITEMEPKTASHVVSKAFPQVRGAVESFNELTSLDGLKTNPDQHLIEIMGGFFLREHCGHHPDLKPHVMELYIRHINTINHVRKLDRYLKPLIPERLNPDISLQLVLASERAMQRNVISTDYLPILFNSVRNLLSVLPERDLSLRHQILEQLASVFDQCSHWINGTVINPLPEDVQRHRVKEVFRGLTSSLRSDTLLARLTDWIPSQTASSGNRVLNSLASLLRRVDERRRELRIEVEGNLVHWARLRYWVTTRMEL